MELFILTLILLTVCFLALGIRIWIRGKFAETEIGSNENMKKLGITCIKDEETKAHFGKSNNSESAGCCSCAFSAACNKVKPD